MKVISPVKKETCLPISIAVFSFIQTTWVVHGRTKERQKSKIHHETAAVKVRIFLYSAKLNNSHCPNKYVFSNRLKLPYDSSHSLRLGGRLFQTSEWSCGGKGSVSKTAARPTITTSVRVSTERSCLTQASATG